MTGRDDAGGTERVAGSPAGGSGSAANGDRDSTGTPPAPSRRSLPRRLLFLGIASLLALLLAEVSLQLLCLASEPVARLLEVIPPAEALVPDPRLRVRGVPGVSGQDARGNRNEGVPAAAPAVALGDSQTWGTSVEREEAWPALLGSLAGCGVYNMGTPGHGPVEHLLRVDEALSLRPRVVVACVFTGNDIQDAHRAVEGTAVEGEVLADGTQADAAARADALGLQDPAVLWTETVSAITGAPRNSRGFGTARLLLSRHCRLYGLLRSLRKAWSGPPAHASFEEAAPLVRSLPPLTALAIRAGERGTLLRIGLRYASLRGDDPRVRRGEAITVAAFRAMAKRCGEGTRLLVVLLPTKETVWRGVPGVSPEGPPEWEALRREEEAMLARLKVALEESGIPALDLLAPLREAVARGEPVNFGDSDDHLAPAGQRLVAERLAAWPPFREATGH